MNVLYSNGDSFVFGMECLEDFSKEERNKEYAFPKHIAEGLRCQTYINNAYNGATNEFIFRTTIFDLLELEKNGTKPEDVFVVVGWTSLNRFEIYGRTWYENQVPGVTKNGIEIDDTDPIQEYVDYGTLFVNPNFSTYLFTRDKSFSTGKDVIPFCLDYIWQDSIQMPQQEARVIALHEFLKSKGYKHIFVNTCGDYKFDYANMQIGNFYKLADESFYDWALTNHKDAHRASNHFAPVAHLGYGSLLLDYITKNLL